MHGTRYPGLDAARVSLLDWIRGEKKTYRGREGAMGKENRTLREGGMYGRKGSGGEFMGQGKGCCVRYSKGKARRIVMRELRDE